MSPLARPLIAATEAIASLVRPEVLFLGDSITKAWPEEDPAFFWPRRIVRGIGGETTREMRARFEADVITARPLLVHIMGGTNDLWHGDPGIDGAASFANLRAMTAGARAHGIVVTLAAPPPIATSAHALFGRPELFGRLVDGIAAIAADEGLTFVDYAASLLDETGQLRPRYTTDGVHLTRAGYRAMRGQAERGIEEALRRPS